MSQASAHIGTGRQSLVEDNHLVILGGASEGGLARARQTMSRAIVQTQTTYRISLSSGEFYFVPYHKITVFT
jgi:hypothetical protein